MKFKEGDVFCFLSDDDWQVGVLTMSVKNMPTEKDSNLIAMSDFAIDNYLGIWFTDGSYIANHLTKIGVL